MPDDAYFDQQRRVAASKGKLLDAMLASDDRDVAIWIGATVELLKWLSNANLEAELKLTKRKPLKAR